MPGLLYQDRVQETSTTTGTGTLTLNGAVVGYQAFSNAFTTGQSVYFCVTDGTNWEISNGVYTTSGTTLTRAQVLSSSNSGSLVSFTAGTKSVFCCLPAEATADMGRTIAFATKIIPI